MSRHQDNNSDINYEKIHEILEAFKKNQYFRYSIETTTKKLPGDRNRCVRMLDIIQETYPTAKVDTFVDPGEVVNCFFCRCDGTYTTFTMYFYTNDMQVPWRRQKPQ